MNKTRECFTPQSRKMYDEEGNAVYLYEGPTPLCGGGEGTPDPGVVEFLDALATQRDREASPQLAAVLDAADHEVDQDLYRAALSRRLELSGEDAELALRERQRAVARAWNRRLEVPVKADYIYPEGENFRKARE